LWHKWDLSGGAPAPSARFSIREAMMVGDGKLQLDDKSDELLSKLLGRIVHDFNNPLAAIIGFADLMRNPRLAPEKRERYVKRIYEQAVKLSQLVETMSYFSAVPDAHVASFNLQRAVADVVSLRQGGIEGGGLKFAFEAPDVLQVSGDRTGMSRILHALLNNAEQVFRENPLMEQREIAVRCGRDDNWGYLEVEDSGPGVPGESKNRIFEPFFSLRRSGGLGLGLTISHTLAEKMGGKLTLMPSDGPLSGARFRLTLPIVV
jgi:signal transduction histidine kinase